MLEIRNISKTYRAKSGVSVRALDRVSLTFGETGMVFLLGKSGSGKSTLLNVIGGLDTYDEGEIIIKGRSSQKFRGSDFDAYRNTFIGFIFQEYNILDEFSVGANIALALELQGKKATSEAINTILEQVDLLDFANRKPNELSGGQKQRIAIARALIKDPQIIMADEPTGALDSTTGKQVLETLKKLSQTKLVLVVSHDREFAETYGDRIIELADGRVISDMSVDEVQEEIVVEDEIVDETAPTGITVVDDSVIHIPRGYTLTLEDMDMINAYLRKSDRDIVLSKDEEINEGVRTKKGIRQARRREKRKVAAGRRPTGTVETRTYNPAETRFIKSRLPLKNAVKMGTASMKAKPVRLIFTIFLSFIAFAMFGLADTMAAYNQFTATVDSLRDSDLKNVAVVLKLRQEHHYTSDGEERVTVWYDTSDALNDDDLAYLKTQTGLDFLGVYSGYSDMWNAPSLDGVLMDKNNLKNHMGHSFFSDAKTGGFVELTQTQAEEMGYTIEGRFPEAEDEIVITEYTYQMLYLAGGKFSNGKKGEDIYVASKELNKLEGDAASIFGKEITLFNRNYKIVGVLNTGFDFNNPRYEAFHWDFKGAIKDKDYYNISASLESELKYGFHTLMVAYPGTISTLPKPNAPVYRDYGAYFPNRSPFISQVDKEGNAISAQYFDRFVGNVGLGDFEIVWFDENQTALGAGEIVVPLNHFSSLSAKQFGYGKKTNPTMPELELYFEQYGGTRTLSDYLLMYEDYVNSHGKSEDKGNLLTQEEYEAKVAEFYNAFFGVTLPLDAWKALFVNNFDGLLYDTSMPLDIYVKYREFLTFVLENWDAVKLESQNQEGSFYTFLQNYGYNSDEYANETEGFQRGMLVSYATKYMNECLNTNGEAFGINCKEFIESKMPIHAERAGEYFSDIFGVDLSYDTWNALRNYNFSGFIDSLANTNLTDYVRVMEFFAYVAENWTTIEAESENTDSGFYEYMVNNRGYDPHHYETQSEDYLKGVIITYAVDYMSEAYWGDRIAFGVSCRSPVDDKVMDYMEKGMENVTLSEMYFGYYHDVNGTWQSTVESNNPLTIVGYFKADNDVQERCLLSENLYQKALLSQSNFEQSKTVWGNHDSGMYVMALSVMPREDRVALEALVTLHGVEEGDFAFRMQNNVTDVIDNYGEMILTLNQVFLYVGIGFAVFAALMMLNFISVSVTYKKKEIGILRALGARSSDVFSIFFSEAFFIALINLALAVVAVFVASYFINYAVRTELGFPITLLHAGLTQVALVLGVSVGVAFIGSFLPVRKIAKKNPIDAMKDR